MQTKCENIISVASLTYFLEATIVDKSNESHLEGNTLDGTSDRCLLGGNPMEKEMEFMLLKKNK